MDIQVASIIRNDIIGSKLIIQSVSKVPKWSNFRERIFAENTKWGRFKILKKPPGKIKIFWDLLNF